MIIVVIFTEEFKLYKRHIKICSWVKGLKKNFIFVCCRLECGAHPGKWNLLIMLCPDSGTMSARTVAWTRSALGHFTCISPWLRCDSSVIETGSVSKKGDVQYNFMAEERLTGAQLEHCQLPTVLFHDGDTVVCKIDCAFMTSSTWDIPSYLRSFASTSQPDQQSSQHSPIRAEHTACTAKSTEQSTLIHQGRTPCLPSQIDRTVNTHPSGQNTLLVQQDRQISQPDQLSSQHSPIRAEHTTCLARSTEQSTLTHQSRTPCLPSQINRAVNIHPSWQEHRTCPASLTEHPLSRPYNWYYQTIRLHHNSISDSYTLNLQI